MKKRKKIRNRLMAMLMLITLCPLMLLGVMSYGKSKKVLKENLVLASKNSIEGINENISKFLLDIEEIININVDNKYVKELGEKKEKVELNEEIVMEMLKNMQENDENIVSIYLGTKDGHMYLYPEEDLTGYDPRTRAWYEDALKNKESVIWTEPYIDATTDQIVITPAKAVEYNGQLVGVIGIDLEINRLAKELSKKTIGKDGYVYITDKNGIIISHRNEKLVGTDEATKLNSWNIIKNNDSDFIDYGEKGEKKFATFETVDITKWKVVGVLGEKELSDSTNSIRIFMIYIGIGALIVCILISFHIANGISKPLNALKAVLKQISKGDLTARVKTHKNDEFGEIEEAFNHMVESIQSLIGEMKESSYVVMDSSKSLSDITEESVQAVTEVAKTIEGIALSSSEQAMNTEYGAVKVNELGTQIDSIANSTNNMKNISNETEKLTIDGLSKVKILTSKSKESYESSVKVNEIVGMVDEKAKNIGVIIDTISQISEQTNLLALNAAIESARAGEHGRGFSVVAQEVRKLAEESSHAANEIRTLIESIQKESEDAVNAMGKVNEIIGQQDIVVGETSKIFNSMHGSIEKLAKAICDVEENSNYVILNKNQIVEGIENISASAEETSAATQQVSATVEEQLASMEQVYTHSQDLKNLSYKLEETVEQFKI
ncbi:MAG: methyl-accepting chemotaxis protein [Anaeromicrobium sp.]|jgi:methyl-accepting chemotaxis protein|uniref:methyl-accepting chemotaxis protein n=1 Tax=Anaeromicrobium sp. TaxID=1929132 RepID=UPI0025F46D49|nr:methyl-accepting chemotaxis protein [Anaeromicrobium sp.]MCT4594341.1 methyl-accepting chemotaxis protein [Anaeromicrobium sp.]